MRFSTGSALAVPAATPRFGSVVGHVAQCDERNHVQQGRTLRRVEHHEHQRTDAHHNRGDRHERVAGSLVAQFTHAMTFTDPTLAEEHMAYGYRRPHHERGQAGHGDQRKIHGRRGHHGRQQGEQAACHAEQHGEHRHAMEIGFGERGRDHMFLGERPDHARAHVQAGVRGGQHCGEHHEVHDVAGERHADGLEDEHERAGVDAGFLPRDERGHHSDGADEEDGQTQHGGVHGLGDGLLRVLGFARGHAHDFGAGEGEHHGEQGGEDRDDAVRQQAFGNEVAEKRRMAVALDGDDAEDCEQADHDERDDGNHLDAGEPEFRFTVQAYGKNIEQEHHDDEHRGPYPCGRIGEPSLHEQARRSEFGGERHSPVQPVEHGDGERGAGADESFGVQVEATGVGHGHRQLAQAQHDEIYEQRADAVGEDRAEWPGLVNGVAGAEEQASADHAAQGDHGQVAGAHLALKAALLVRYFRSRGSRRLRGFHCFHHA